jgi:hypothetical protein
MAKPEFLGAGAAQRQIVTMSSSRHVWTGGAVLLLLLAGYMLVWWNRGLQLNSNGLGTLAAQEILAGKAPYRDFHFWCPPGALLLYTALTALFGDALIYVRAFALVERTTTLVLVYFWLARIVSARAAFFGTFTAGVAFSADIGDVISHYGFDAVLASVAAGFSASLAMTSARKYARTMYFVTGICAGCCMLAKQTEGVGVFCVFITIFLIGDVSRPISYRVRSVLEFLAGWLVPTGLVSWWLVRAGAWHAFLNQVFLQGSASKGSLVDILFRPVLTLLYEDTLRATFLIAISLMLAYAWLSRRENRLLSVEQVPSHSLPWSLWAACLAAMAVGFVWAFAAPGAGENWLLERILAAFSAIFIFIGFYGTVWLSFRYLPAAIQGNLTADRLQKWIIASVSAVTAYMFALSWAAFEQMLIPGFAFLLALALDRHLRRRRSAIALAIFTLGLLLICTSTFRKLTWPYAWENWVDGPIKTETEQIDFPELRGLRVTPESAQFVNSVTRIIDAHSKPNETILCYPNYAIFYVLAHRAPATFAYMHWFDIASDALVREDVDRIRKHPPAVVLSVDLPEAIILRAETNFRGGRRSGQRDMFAAIESLPGLRLIETVPIPHCRYSLKIYAHD